MESPQSVVTKLIIATDEKDWFAVENSFHTKVILDYSSMNGNPATELSPEQIVESWKGILPGFDHTHHQLGNFIVKEEQPKVTVFCYGTATHYLNDAKGNLWTVVGTYDFELILSESKTWKISKMKFNFKFQEGNTTLPEKAMNNLN